MDVELNADSSCLTGSFAKASKVTFAVSISPFVPAVALEAEFGLAACLSLDLAMGSCGGMCIMPAPIMALVRRATLESSSILITRGAGARELVTSCKARVANRRDWH